MAKTKISEFLNFYFPHAIKTNGKAADPAPKGQWGYAMGAKGEILTDKLADKFARYQSGYSYSTYIKKLQKWMGRLVVDCNGMSEYFTGYDTKARYNYRDQCNPKSPTKADKALASLPQMPGVAVFSGDSASSISHVGHLLYKYGPGDLDWYVVEARGVDYGVVITKLRDRNWRWWGVMSKYFDYDVDASWRPGKEPAPEPEPVPTPVIKTATKPFLVSCGRIDEDGTVQRYTDIDNARKRFAQVYAAVGEVYWRDQIFIAQIGSEYTVCLGEYNKRPAPSAETREQEAIAAFEAAGANNLVTATEIQKI